MISTETRYPKGKPSPYGCTAPGTTCSGASYGGSGGSTTSYKGGGNYRAKGTGRHRVTKSSGNSSSPSGDSYPKSRHSLFEGERYY